MSAASQRSLSPHFIRRTQFITHCVSARQPQVITFTASKEHLHKRLLAITNSSATQRGVCRKRQIDRRCGDIYPKSWRFSIQLSAVVRNAFDNFSDVWTISTSNTCTYLINSIRSLTRDGGRMRSSETLLPCAESGFVCGG